MPKYNVKYSGQLRTISEHLKSGSTIITDAPVDNQGKGEAFSPTDLSAISLATCIVTVMGIKAQDLGLPDLEMSAEVDKVMIPNPRRISTITVNIQVKDQGFDLKTRTILERVGIDCPVAKSLHPEIDQQINFEYY